MDHLQKPKAVPFRFGATDNNHEWLVASPLTDDFTPTIRDEQKETLYHIENHGVWIDVMYHKPLGEEPYLRTTFKRGADGRKINDKV